MEPDGKAVRVPMRTGTHGDVLAAVGMADLLGAAFTRGVRLEAVEGAFLVRIPEPLSPRVLARIGKAPGYPYMRPNERTSFPVEVPENDRLDYPAVNSEQKRKREAMKSLRKEERLQKAGKATAELHEFQVEQRPRRDWSRWQAFNLLQGDETANRIYLKIRQEDGASFPATLETGIRSLDGTTDPPQWGASPVQLFTPSWAKGYSRLKPDSTDRNKNVNEHWVNSFEEWLKYRGYFRVACPYFVGPKREHIRLICPIPDDISAAVLSTVCDRLLDARLFGSDPKVDALSVLTLAGILLDYSDDSEEQDTFRERELFGRTPADIISGVHVTHYQSLGQARAVSALGTLALPGWFPVDGPKELQLWHEILDEHQAILRGLRDDHSDEIGLLVLYRRFLERRMIAALRALLEFMGAYGCLVMKATGSKSGNVVRRLRRFRTDLFERLVRAMDKSLVSILTDPGFRAVAAAIRDATVSAQVRRAARMPGHTNDRWIREIRYDLIPELRRKRTLPRAAGFLEVVADFVASYNVENDRRRETYRTKHPYASSEDVMRSAPRNLTVEEFSRFSALCERHDVSTVGALLCAYASCREPREEVATEPSMDANASEAEGDNE